MICAQAKLVEVFTLEFAATRSLESAVTAVATTVRAQLELPLHEPRPERRPRSAPPDSTQVVALTAHEFGVTVAQMCGRLATRRTINVQARWTAIAVLRRTTGLSLKDCGQAVGIGDHSSVIHAIRGVKERPDLLAAVERIEAALGVSVAPRAEAA
jgi:chromosomal replication initiation ATPase DnaA